MKEKKPTTKNGKTEETVNVMVRFKESEIAPIKAEAKRQDRSLAYIVKKRALQVQP